MKKAGLALFFLLCCALVSAQEKMPLQTVLSDIEKQHKVRFSFLESDVGPVSLLPPSATFDLNQKLHYLQTTTGLRFETVVEGYISISSRKDQEDMRQAVRLSEVSVSNILTTGISKKQDGAFVIRPRKMGMLPGLTETDILQAMQQIPGITSANDLISDINIRGGTHDQNLFLWNGIRMFQTGHFFGQISAFNPNLNSRIEILRNGSSAFYGESVSGIVSVTSTSESDRDFEHGVSSNLISAEFNSRVALSPDATIKVSGRRSVTDFYRSPTYRSYYDRIFRTATVTREDDQVVDYRADENFFFYDATLQYDQKIGEKHRASFSGIIMENRLYLDENIVGGDALTAKDSDLKQRSLGGILDWETHWNDDNVTKAQLYFSGFDLDSKNEKIDNSQIFTQRNTVSDLGLRVENRHRIAANLTFANGYQYQETGVRNDDEVNIPAYRRKTKSVLRTHSLIAETEWKPDALRVKAGIRGNYISEFDKMWVEPRLAVQYLFSRKWSATFLAERKSQSISQTVERQQDFLGIEKRRWILSNDGSVPVQRSTQAEIGFIYNDSRWLVTLDNFYKKVDGITTESQSFQNQLELIRLTGSYAVFGSELLVQRDFRNFRTWIAYSFNDNNYEFPLHFPASFTNNFELAHTVNFAGIATFGRLKTSLGGKWNSGRPYTEPVSGTLLPGQNQIAYRAPNGARLGSGLQLNFSAAYQWQWENGRLSANFAILNLLNTRNPLQRYYRINRNDNTVEKIDFYGLGRTPNFSLRYEF